MVLAGGRHCGAIRYATDGETGDAALCHCVDCRRTTGAPAVAWFTAPAGRFRFTRGEPAVYASSDHAERTFCGHCGTQLTFVERAYSGERIDIATASLDDPAAAPPAEHIWTRSRLAWMRGLDALPERPMAERP